MSTSVEISPHTAAIVLAYFGSRLGYPGSSGEDKLIDAIASTSGDYYYDGWRRGFPAEFEAVQIARRLGGINVLASIVQSAKPMSVIA